MDINSSTTRVRTDAAQAALPVLNRLNLKSFMESQHGKIMSVDFVKKDGTTRTMTCRTGAAVNLKGGSNKVESCDRPYITVFDMLACEYRTVNLATVFSIRAGGSVLTVS